MRVRRDELRKAVEDRDRLAHLLDPLAAEAAAGDRESLELIVWAVDELELALPAIRRLVINQADVEDVNQDVLIAVAETIGGFKGESRFRTWLNQVARFKAIAHLRRKRDVHELNDEDSDTFRISSLLATRASLRDVLDGLPDNYQTAVVLRDVERLSYDELSRQLEININTAKSWVARGRALAAARLVNQLDQ